MNAVTITLLMAAGLANVAVAQFGTLPTCAVRFPVPAGHDSILLFAGNE